MTQLYSTLISAKQLKAIINQLDLRVFDCRFNLMDEKQGHEHFRQGHIENSQYADLNEQLASPISSVSGRHPLPGKSEFERQLQNWGIDENSQIVVYDDAFGAIAARLWWLCKWAGLNNVAVLDGGLKSWLANDYSLDSNSIEFEKTDYSAHFNDSLWVSTEVIEALKSHAGCLLTDARAGKRFKGESEPIDKQAGHIPGAMNYAFENNLDEKGLFLDQQELVAIHQQAPEITQVISMCGSGVTACHNILARTHAGLEPGKLYVGSWSEWIRQPDHEIACG